MQTLSVICDEAVSCDDDDDVLCDSTSTADSNNLDTLSDTDVIAFKGNKISFNRYNK